MIVISVIVVSLLESLFILPAHLSFGKHPKKGENSLGALGLAREGFVRRMENFIQGPYNRLLELCLRNRYVTIAIAVVSVLITIGLIQGGGMKFHFMPEVEGDEIIVKIPEMPRGTPVEKTAQAHDHIVGKAKEIVAEYDRDRPGGIR